jgi:excisionase family DNA binding protein
MELERRYSLKEAQETLGISERTIHRWIKSGKLKSYKPGRDHQIPESAIRKVIEDSEVYPKDLEPPLPFDSEERRRLTQVPEVLGEYMLGRMERHEAELDAADSAHFRTATSATLWLAAVEEEAAAWSGWALNEATKIMPVPRAGSTVSNLVERFYDGLELMAFRIPFEGLKNRAEARIEAMNGVPDELASLRLAKADAAVDEARERFEELRAVNG